MIRSIAHPTDFSPEGMLAFAHALKLALVNRSTLDLVHVRSPGDAKHWEDFPHVREYLERWGILSAGSKLSDVADKTGVKVSKVEIADADPVDGLSRYLSKHRPDLIVMASHGRSGLNRWMAGSVSAEVAQRSRAPTLLFGPLARPFVDPQSGELALGTILVPIDHAPRATDAIPLLESLSAQLGAGLDFLHVGQDAPRLHDTKRAAIAVRRIDGPVIDTILAEAAPCGLVAMPTAGRQGILDALRGSTTERVVREAPCPVLALPAEP